jgi:hypothetical protein
MQEFVDDDQGYFSWLRRNPWGYVVNTPRTPSPSYLMLHLSTCQSISQLGGKGTTFTGEYRKVCSSELSELRNWAMRVGGELKRCGQCEP